MRNNDNQGRSEEDLASAANIALWILIGLAVVWMITCTHQPVSNAGSVGVERRAGR